MRIRNSKTEWNQELHQLGGCTTQLLLSMVHVSACGVYMYCISLSVPPFHGWYSYCYWYGYGAVWAAVTMLMVGKCPTALPVLWVPISWISVFSQSYE